MFDSWGSGTVRCNIIGLLSPVRHLKTARRGTGLRMTEARRVTARERLLGGFVDLIDQRRRIRFRRLTRSPERRNIVGFPPRLGRPAVPRLRIPSRGLAAMLTH
jgi:hypothetical protein